MVQYDLEIDYVKYFEFYPVYSGDYLKLTK